MKILKIILDSLMSIVRYVLNNKKLWLLPAIVIFLLLNFVFSQHGIINRIKLEIEQDELIEKISFAKLQSDSLKQRKIVLTFDSLEIERIAREYYGMLKPNEKLYIYKKIGNKE